MASRVFVVRGHEMDDSYTYGFGSAASSSPASSTSLTCCGAAAPGMVVMCWVYGSGGSGATPYYPGDSYVDWIGIGPYDPKLLKGSPTATYQPFITYLNGVSFGHGKPLGIFETGVDQPPPNTDKAAAAWIDDVPACLADPGGQFVSRRRGRD